MNVAAYCRVSTDREDQINSLENQMSFFREYIQRNPDWNLVGIYSDEGVTGTSVAKRAGFHSMIQAAKDGKIDFIVTKEVSRFARNTVDTLNYTRELRKNNIGVYFINDNINTLDCDGEFRLSIMASVAQEESRKTSSRVRWGMKRQMEKGFVFSPPLLGYDLHSGFLTVNEEEAKIVRRIFDLYVNRQMGTGTIARTLAKENVPLCKRIQCWSPTLIMRILKNEKYAGDLIQQKTVVKDYLNHRSVPNEEDKMVFRNHHEPIIEREVWEKAQRICAERRGDHVEHNPQRHCSKYWCSGKIQCGICGGSCITKTKKAQYGNIRVYRCKHTTFYRNEGGACTNKTYIDERILIACMQYAVRKMSITSDEVMADLSEALHHSEDCRDMGKQIEALEKKLLKLEQKKKRLLELLVGDTITAEDYQSSSGDIDGDILRIKENIHMLKCEQGGREPVEKQISAVLTQAQKYLRQSEPTIYLYDQILEKMVVHGDNHVDVCLIGAEPVSVKYSRTGRGEQYTVYCEDFERGNALGYSST